MKHFLIYAGLMLTALLANAQMPEHIASIFPKATIFHQNIPYANNTPKKHLLNF